MKKTIAIILALVMALSMTAFAASAASGSYDDGAVGTITISRYNKNNNYYVYRMLKLASFNTEGGLYSYEYEAEWEDFFKGEGAAYVTLQGKNVTWNTNVSDTLAVEFAEKALAYARANDIDPVAASNGTDGIDGANGIFTYTFTNLNLGYYLVDSTMGSLCGLTTTNPYASINAKNGEPTLNLHIQENSTTLWGLENTANIGDTVEYRVTVFVQPGAENYRLHVELDDTLINPTDIIVEYDGKVIAMDGNYTIKTNGFEDECDLAIFFSDTFCESLSSGKNLFVYFEATLTEDAVINGAGNKVTALMQFGEISANPDENHFTAESEVTTYTYAFDLVKTDKQNALLDGAWFKMYRLVGEDYVEVPLALDTDAQGKSYYRPTVAGEVTVVDAVKGFEVDTGIIRFQGFDSGDYYFKETLAPDGYNILTNYAKFTLGTANKDALFNEDVYSSGSGFHITNQSGAMLPETGAMGTVLFITFGTLAVIATGVLLVTKKRMTMIQD